MVVAPDGQVAGYIEVWATARPPVHPWIWGRVDPDFEGMGIGTWMLSWAEQRAMEALPLVPEELRFAPRLGTYRQAERPRRLFEKLEDNGTKGWMRVECPDVPGLVKFIESLLPAKTPA